MLERKCWTDTQTYSNGGRVGGAWEEGKSQEKEEEEEDEGGNSFIILFFCLIFLVFPVQFRGSFSAAPN